MMTLEQSCLDVLRKVKSIYRALMTGGLPSPEEMARQCRACLVAAAGIRLKAGGWRPWSEGGDELAQRMADAAFDAMEAEHARWVAERN